MYTLRFLDGSPVDPDYATAIAKLVRDAADADVGEEEEAAVLAAYRSGRTSNTPHPESLPHGSPVDACSR